MGQPGQATAIRSLWAPRGWPEGTGHSIAVAEPCSHGTAQPLNPNKITKNPHGEHRDGAGSGGQAGHADGVASRDPRAHARAHGGAGTFPSILRKAVISSLSCFGNHLNGSPSARVPAPAGDAAPGLGNGRAGAEQGHPSLRDTATSCHHLLHGDTLLRCGIEGTCRGQVRTHGHTEAQAYGCMDVWTHGYRHTGTQRDGHTDCRTQGHMRSRVH